MGPKLQVCPAYRPVRMLFGPVGPQVPSAAIIVTGLRPGAKGQDKLAKVSDVKCGIVERI